MDGALAEKEGPPVQSTPGDIKTTFRLRIPTTLRQKRPSWPQLETLRPYITPEGVAVPLAALTGILRRQICKAVMTRAARRKVAILS